MPSAESVSIDEARILQRLALVSSEKDKGNERFKASDWEGAAKHYERACKLSATISLSPAHNSQEAWENLVLSCLNNLAQANFKLGDYRSSVVNCTDALKINPHNEKALYRRGMSKLQLGDRVAAIEDLQEVLRVNSENKEAKKALKDAMGGKSGLGSKFNGMLLNRRDALQTKQSKDQGDVGEWDGSKNGRDGVIPYTGIRNEGATCYVNSVLQSLFHIPAIRNMVYSIPTEPVPRDAKMPVIVALQRLFCRLETSRGMERGASATELMASFGWDADDTLTQQDVGEMVSVLLDPVEEALKKANLPPHVARLVNFSMRYTDRIDKPKSKEEEEWIVEREGLVFPFNVDYIKESAGLCEALERMTRHVDVIEDFNTSFDYEETKRQLAVALERGDDKSAGECKEALDKIVTQGKIGYGTKNIVRRSQIRVAPPLLFLRLQRVEFCQQRQVGHKIHSRFEFPEVLDMSPFLAQPSPTCPRPPHAEGRVDAEVVEQGGRGAAKYRLYGVVTHFGSSYGGHYVSYLRPPPGDDWFKFDDDKVTRVSGYEAIEANFGGTPMSYMQYPSALRSAYMLIYLVEGTKCDGMLGTSFAHVPLHVKRAVEEGHDAQAKLPLSFSIALPIGQGVGGVRGEVVEVSIPGGGTPRVSDLLSLVATRTPSHDLATPSLQDYYASILPSNTPPTHLFRPHLCLTLVRGHHIVHIFDGDTPLWQLSVQAGAGLLRCEWCVRDGEGEVECVRVAHAEWDGEGGEEARYEVPFSLHGDPLLLPILPGEGLEEVVMRLQAMLGVEWDLDDPSFKYALIHDRSPRNWKWAPREGALLRDPSAMTDTTLLLVHKREEGGPRDSDFRATSAAKAAQRSRIRIR